MPRKKKPPLVSLSGATLEDWQKNNELVEWAQQDRRFQMILTVLINEAGSAVSQREGSTENRLLGNREGYESAIDILKAMKSGWREETPPEDEMVYAAGS